MLVTTTEMLAAAKQGRYGIGAFNVENLEFVMAVLTAAEQSNAPVIMQTTPTTTRYAGVDEVMRDRVFYALLCQPLANATCATTK